MATTCPAVKTERLQEMMAAIAMRHREIEQLTARKAELARFSAKTSVVENGDAADHAAKAGVSSVATELLQQFPALAFCTTQRADDVWDVAPEQIGNINMQLEAAMQALAQRRNAVAKSLDTISIQKKQSDERNLQLDERIKLFSELTGLAPSRKSAKAKTSRPASSSAGGSPMSAYQNNNPEASRDVSSELKKMQIILTKEIRTGETLRQKNVKALSHLNAQLEKGAAIVEAINEAKNRIRCKKRDINEKKKTLEELLAQHEQLDKQLAIAMSPCSATHTTRLILDRDVTELKKQVDDYAEGERRVQDRVIKAQEYRILMLEKRLASIRRAVHNHGLTEKVDGVIIGSVSQHVEPSSLGLETPANKDELYDIERIVPPQEQIHPAIYSLFVSEKESLAKKVHLQQMTIREKDSAVDAMADEVARLTMIYDEAQALLDATAMEMAMHEDQQKDAYVASIMEQRQQYNALLKEKIALRREAHNTWLASRSDSGSRSGLSSKEGSVRSGSSPQPCRDHLTQEQQQPVFSQEIPQGMQEPKKSASRVRFVDCGGDAANPGTAPDPSE